MRRLRKILVWSHFVIMGFVILNECFKSNSNFSLNSSVEYLLERIVLITGILIFSIFLKSNKWFNFYFALYPSVALFAIIATLTRNFTMGVLLYALLYIVTPDQTYYNDSGFTVYNSPELIGVCCDYHLKENKLLIFEKRYGSFSPSATIDFSTLDIVNRENEIELNYKVQIIHPRDETLIIKLQ